MCIFWKEDWQRAPFDYTAYKVVRWNRRSAFKPENRKRQAGCKNSGVTLRYTKGTTLVSSAPGIYLYRVKTEAEAIWRNDLAAKTHRILRVTIPKGTWVRRGSWQELTALRVKVET